MSLGGAKKEKIYTISPFGWNCRLIKENKNISNWVAKWYTECTKDLARISPKKFIVSPPIDWHIDFDNTCLRTKL